MDAIVEIGINFNLWIEEFRNVPLTNFFMFFHFAGSKYGFIVLVILAGLCRPKLAFPLAGAVLASWVINVGLKELIALPRPFVLGTTNPLFRPSSYSFPSGHAQAAGLFWGFWLFQSKSFKATIVLITLILFIGFSRVYLGVHYFTDVIAGWTIGLILAYATFKACEKFNACKSKVSAL